MILNMELGKNSYDIVLKTGVIDEASSLLELDRKALIVTDDGVPADYSKRVAAQCSNGIIYTITQGEQSKCFENYKRLLELLVENAFTRTDCVIAVGGGVVGDLAGFVAASYMRGIDFYNIPTTMLSQVDSSIGGKVAIDFGGYKNLVGAFYQPKKVLVDSDVLKTLPPRQLANGLSEAVKMALTFDRELFELFESCDVTDNLTLITERSLRIKKSVVEQDEKESGLRKVLNFGHTLGHAIESTQQPDGLYHGECVALGMLPMCSPPVRKRLETVLKKLGLPTQINCNCDSVTAALKHDKKAQSDNITVIYVEQIGSFVMKTIPLVQLENEIKEVLTV